METSDLIWKAGLRKGLRAETIKTYAYSVDKFLRIYKKEPHIVTKRDVEDYIIQLIKKDRSGNTINVHLHALKFFFWEVLGKKLMVAIPPLPPLKRLPECLTQEETMRLFESITHSKHWLIIALTYGSGFRVSEATSLKVKDLNLETGFGLVRNGKGGKERMFIIPEMLNQKLRDWIVSNKLEPEDWLFLGYKNQHYSNSSVRVIVEQARLNAGISRHITPHSLRHSFATHLLENGYSLIEVNKLLGHSRLETTMKYTHLANPKLTRVKSPLDSLSRPTIDINNSI